MSRLITACVLIFSIIAVSVFGILYIKNKKDECSEILQTAYNNAKADNIELSQENVNDFCKKWDQLEKILIVFLHRQDLDEITFSSRAIFEYIKAQELPEFFAETKKIMALLDHTFETEMPLLQNIL